MSSHPKIETKTIDSHRAPPLRAITDNGAPAPSNDNATAGGHLDTTHLVARRDVARYLRATLQRHGVAPQDTADAIADVQLASIEAARTGQMPSGAAQWKALAATIAARSAIDRLRANEARAKYDTGFCGAPDAFTRPAFSEEERDPVETKKYLAVLEALFDSGQMPEHAAEILWGEAEQIPHAEIAAEVGVTETVVDNRLCRMRKTFRARLAALGLLPLLLLLLAAVLDAPSDRRSAPAVRSPPAEPAPPGRGVPGWDAGAPRSENSSSPVRGKCALPD